MKIIDLLNKIANEEELPLKIKYNNVIYKYENGTDDYSDENGRLLFEWLFRTTIDFLNDEIEIINDDKYELLKSYIYIKYNRAVDNKIIDKDLYNQGYKNEYNQGYKDMISEIKEYMEHEIE